MKANTAALALALASLISCTKGDRNKTDGRGEESVSLVALIANPRAYDGATVTTVGFAHFAHEHHALFIGELDYLHFITKNSVWMEYPDGLSGRLDEFNDKYAVVTGRFDADDTGHLGQYSGTLQITYIRTNDPEKVGENDQFHAFP